MKKIYILIIILIVVFIISICLISKNYNQKNKTSIIIAYKEPGFAYNKAEYISLQTLLTPFKVLSVLTIDANELFNEINFFVKSLQDS